MTDRAVNRLRENATGIVALAVTGTWLAALLSGQGWWLPFMLFGYIVIVPIVAILTGEPESLDGWTDEDAKGRDRRIERGPTDEGDPLETLRSRYARGELTDEEFERKLDRLLETETIEGLTERRRRRRRDAEPGTETE